MNIRIEGNRVVTTSPYNPDITRAVKMLEGARHWRADKTFSFENTTYNLDVWRRVFPTCQIEQKVEEKKVRRVEGRPEFVYKTKPREHQKKALRKLYNLPASGLFMDVGTGKSWTAITMMGARWCEGLSDHVLLIAKNGVHRQWVEEQIPAHLSPVVPYKAWVYKKGKRAEDEYKKMLAFDGLKIFAINIDALITPYAQELIEQFLNMAEGSATMIVDESQDIKNISAKRTKVAIRLGKYCAYRTIMSGTPIAKDVVDLFSQFKFLDESIIGHKYLTTFKSDYCIVRATDFGEMIVGYKNIENLYGKIDPYIFRITSEEALDLPPKVYDERVFALSDEQKKLISQLKKQFFAELESGELSSVKTAAALVARLQQISCGFLPTDDGGMIRLPNPRLDALKDILEQREGKAIIWCRFNEDVRTVVNCLGDDAVHYYGNTEQRDRERGKNEFLDPQSRIRYLVASPEAAGTGLNLQGICRTNIYYSNSFNSLARWQSEGRTWRDGTSGTVTYFDLIAEGSPDKKILKNLKDKKSISDMTLDDFRKMLDD